MALRDGLNLSTCSYHAYAFVSLHLYRVMLSVHIRLCTDYVTCEQLGTEMIRVHPHSALVQSFCCACLLPTTLHTRTHARSLTPSNAFSELNKTTSGRFVWLSIFIFGPGHPKHLEMIESSVKQHLLVPPLSRSCRCYPDFLLLLSHQVLTPCWRQRIARNLL